MGRFSTWSQSVSDLPSNGPRKNSMGALQGMIKSCMPIITKQALRFELEVSRVLNPD